VSLEGRHVVVTRPTGQAAHLATELTARGARPVLYPVLEIRDIDDIAPVLDASWRATASTTQYRRPCVLIPRPCWNFPS
jgi:uroporphyrinogen-III synthase